MNKMKNELDNKTKKTTPLTPYRAHQNQKRAKSAGDLRKFEQLPIQTGVSVRALVSFVVFVPTTASAIVIEPSKCIGQTMQEKTLGSCSSMDI